MKYISSILLFVSLVACSQEKLPVNKMTLNSSAPLLIIIYGESNGGGRAANSDATTEELATRTNTKILNNWTLGFESLDIGVNNLIGHWGLNGIWYTAHGFELQIANMVDAGELPNPTYIVKCAQGGTNAAKLMKDGDLYEGINSWDTMTKRVDAAIAEITSIEEESPQIFVFYSQGLNDIQANQPATWITNTKTIFADMREAYDIKGIFMTQFNMSGQTGYNDEIATICHTTPQTYYISSDGATTNDALHWDYAGMKLVAKRLVNKMRSFF